MTLVGLSVAVIVVAITAGAVIGAGVAQGAPTADPPSGLEIFRHNLRTGLLTTSSGWLTGGVGALAVAAVGFGANGVAIGANVETYGWSYTLARLPHLLPEVLTFALFLGAGLCVLVAVAEVVRGGPIGPALGRSALRSACLLAVAGPVLAVAAVVESTVP